METTPVSPSAPPPAPTEQDSADASSIRAENETLRARLADHENTLIQLKQEAERRDLERASLQAEVASLRKLNNDLKILHCRSAVKESRLRRSLDAAPSEQSDDIGIPVLEAHHARKAQEIFTLVRAALMDDADEPNEAAIIEAIALELHDYGSRLTPDFSSDSAILDWLEANYGSGDFWFARVNGSHWRLGRNAPKCATIREAVLQAAGLTALLALAPQALADSVAEPPMPTQSAESIIAQLRQFKRECLSEQLFENAAVMEAAARYIERWQALSGGDPETIRQTALKHLMALHDRAHALAKAGPLLTPSLDDAWKRFLEISSRALNGVMDVRVAGRATAAASAQMPGRENP